MHNQFIFPNTKKSTALQSIAMRLGFHCLAITISFVALALFINIPAPEAMMGNVNSTDKYEAIAAASVYFSLLLLFPRRMNIVDTAFGIITAVVWLFFGPLPIGLMFGGILVFICRLFRERKYIIWSSVLPLLLLLGWFPDLYTAKMIPLFYWLFFTVITAVAALYSYRSSTDLFDSHGAKYSKEEIEQKRAELRVKRKEKEQKLSQEEIRKRAVIEQHKKSTLELIKFGQRLPIELASSIVIIAEHAKLILGSMETDPRDFEPGDKFLTRYIAAAQMISENNTKLSTTPQNQETYSQTIEQSKQTLKSLEQAFVEQHHRLLENDVLDFTVELNVLERLLKIEGFNEPKI